MSDIFGTLAEYHFNNNPDWLIGEDIYTPWYSWRCAAFNGRPNINKEILIIILFATQVQPITAAFILTLESVIKLHYLLSNGGTHYGVSVAGIGNDKTGKIFYRTLTQYLTPNSTFSQYRAASVQAATDLYGASSSEVSSVKAAFTAVGVN